MAQRFALKYNGTMITMFDSEDNQIGGEYNLESVTSDDEFVKWGGSDSLYCRFTNEATDEDEVYVKIANQAGGYEAMTLTEANEAMADPDSQYYTGGSDDEEPTYDYTEDFDKEGYVSFANSNDMTSETSDEELKQICQTHTETVATRGYSCKGLESYARRVREFVQNEGASNDEN